MYWLTTRTLPSGSWKYCAYAERRSKTPWFVSWMISRSPSHFTTEPCVSIGVWISQGVRKVISTTASASAKPFATSPRSCFSGSPARFPPSWRAGAPGSSAFSKSTTKGSSSYSTAIAFAAARASWIVSAATAATSSPSCRQCGSKSQLSGPFGVK